MAESPEPPVGLLRDRTDAGHRLGERLEGYRTLRPVVLGIPRGGIVVASEIARELSAPLDVLVVRKIGDPFNPEYGLGAVAEGGVRLLDERRILESGRTVPSLEPVIALELRELERRLSTYRAHRPRVELRGRTVILVDDGVATGGTVRAGLKAVRAAGALKVVLAFGVCAHDTFESLRREADDIIAIQVPRRLTAVGEWFEDFREVSDEEVGRCLRTNPGLDRPDGTPAPAG